MDVRQPRAIEPSAPIAGVAPRTIDRRPRPVRLTKAQRARLFRKLLKLYGLNRGKLRHRHGRRSGREAPPVTVARPGQAISRVVHLEDLRLAALGEVVRHLTAMGSFLGTTVVVRPAPRGAGLSGPEVATGVLDTLGMRDLTIDIYGTRSLDAVANATLVALRAADAGNALLAGIETRPADPNHAG